MYFTGSKTFWKNFEMWKFWSFLKMPKILQSVKLCWGVWRSDIFPPTQNIKNTKETDHFAPRFSFLFIRPIFHEICPFFSEFGIAKHQGFQKHFIGKPLPGFEFCFGVFPFCPVKSYSNGGQTNYSAIPSWNSRVFKCCRFPKHLNTVKEIDLKR